MNMKPVDQVGFSSSCLLDPAQRPGAQRSGDENRGSSAHRALSDVDASLSHALSFGNLGPLPTARSAPFSATMSYAALKTHQQADLMVTEDAPTFSCCSTRSSGDVSLGANCGHLLAGAKRARTLASSGDGASTQTEPSQPSQLRKLTSLPAQFSQYNEDYQASSAAHRAGQLCPQAPPLPNADEQIGQLQRHLGVIAQLLGAAGAATTMHGCEANRCCRPATLTAVAAPCSTSQVMDVMATSGGQLSALMSVSMPAFLEQLAATPGLAPVLPQGTPCAASGGPHKHSDTRRAATVDGESSGNASISAYLTATTADWSGAKPSGGATRTLCGAGTRKGGEVAAEVVVRGTAGPVGPAMHSLKLENMGACTAATEVKAEKATQRSGAYVGDADAAAIGPVISALPPDQSFSQQPVEPVSSQVGAALPPEVAARLKKPIRIIQPISKAWVKEILQSTGSLAAGAAKNVNQGGGPSAAATSAHAPTVLSANGVAGSCFPGSGIGAGAAAAVAAAAEAALPLSNGAAAAAAGARVAQAWTTVGGSSAARSAMAHAAAPVAELPVKIDLQDLPARMGKVTPVVAAAPAASSAPMQPATASMSASLMQPPRPAALAPALAALASFPLADAASPFTMGSLGALAPHQTVAGPSRSGAAVMPPRRSFESNTTTLSATPTTAAASPFSSGFLLPGSGCGTTRPGSSSDTAAAASIGCGAMITTAAPTVASRLQALAAAGPALAALLAGSAPYSTAAAAGAHSSRSPPNVFPRNRVPVGLTLPLQSRPLLQPAASTAASTSASCLGKVQCELTLLYQWYAANKAMYLDQAQRQLQRIEALAAAAQDGGAVDAAAATCVRIESAEAARAFETALKIMSVCGRVEQQWLAGPSAPASGGGSAAGPLAATPPAPLRASAANVGRTLVPEPLARLPGSACVQLPANVPAPANGWAHGASAALAVAAALVGSVGLEPCPAPAPVGPALALGGPAKLAFSGMVALPSAGVPLSAAVQGLQAMVEDPRPPSAAAAMPAVAVAASLPLRASAAAAPSVIAPLAAA